MKVAELAKQLNTTTEAVLQALKSLRLKAKDSQQELSGAVVSVVRSALISKGPVKGITRPEPAQSIIPKRTKTNKEVTKQQEGAKSGVIELLSSNQNSLTGVGKEKLNKKLKVEKKKTLIKTAEPSKPRISKEPMITLKPLARRRKKAPASLRTDTRPGIFENLEKKKTPSSLDIEIAEQETIPTTEVKTQGHVEEHVAKVAIEEPLTEEPLQEIEINVPITVKDLSIRVQQKPSAILKILMKLGVLAHINQILDEDVVKAIIHEFGYTLIKVKTQEEYMVESHKQEDVKSELFKPRSPVVTLMGHVDHGKTTLLDSIRKTKVADTEHGGITQHIGAYSVEIPKGRITFLDTPGHEAFTAMRARGAHITDIVILVVAADEGIMPQTKEAINHARVASVPIVVAITKIDHPHADIDRVKKQLSEEGLNPEDWGGKTVCVGVSAVRGEGIDTLLEMILLEAELLELKVNDEKKASGVVVEAHLSKGKGVVATLIVQSGTLRGGDIIVVGSQYGKIKAMYDDHERLVDQAGPSIPVEVLGLSEVPEAGEKFYVIEKEKQAKEITLRRQEQRKDKRLRSVQRVTLSDLYAKIQEGSVKELNVIIKADVQGSVEALKDSLDKIPSDKVKLRFIHMGVGEVNASDVLLAVVSDAIIIAFHVGIEQRAKEELDKEPVEVRQYRIIYDAVNDIKKALEGMLEAKLKKNFLSRIEIRQVFKLSKGTVAGCYVQKGRLHRKANVDVVREGKVIYSGLLNSLKRFKDDVREVNEGMECGIGIEGFDAYQSGDMLEAYELEAVAQKL